MVYVPSCFEPMCVTCAQDIEWQWHNMLGAAIATVGTMFYFYYSPHRRAHTAQPSELGAESHRKAQGTELGDSDLKHDGAAHQRIQFHQGQVDHHQQQQHGPQSHHVAVYGSEAAPKQVRNSGGGVGQSDSGSGQQVWSSGFRFTKAKLANAAIIVILLASPFELSQGARKVIGKTQSVASSVSSHSWSDGVFVAGMHQSHEWSPFLQTAQISRAPAAMSACSSAQQQQDGGNAAGTKPLPPSATDAVLGLYTGWIGRDNLGDEIVWDIFFDLMTATILEHTTSETEVTVDRNNAKLLSQYPECSPESGSGCDFAVLGGGSTGAYAMHVKQGGCICHVRTMLPL